MRIGICDDAADDRGQLRALLHAHLPDVSLLEYTSGEALLAGLNDGDQLDLLFLDIYMGGMNGMETAERLRVTHKQLPIIFLTTSPDFALSAFGVRAIGYLLKPVDQGKLTDYLQDFCNPNELADNWLVSTGQADITLTISQITYCEQQGNYVEVHMEDGTLHPVRMTFADVEGHLGRYPNIAPCGRSYLLNLSFIRTLNRQAVTLANGVTLPVPRRSFTALRESYLDFYKGGA